jgi:hypothetical protein
MTDTQDFIRSELTHALIYENRMELPPLGATDDCNTHADSEAVHLPFFRDFEGFLRHSITAHVLLRITEADPVLAASIVNEIDSYAESGDAYPEMIWDWAIAAGLKPDEIVTKAREDREAWLKSPIDRRRTSSDARPGGGS